MKPWINFYYCLFIGEVTKWGTVLFHLASKYVFWLQITSGSGSLCAPFICKCLSQKEVVLKFVFQQHDILSGCMNSPIQYWLKARLHEHARLSHFPRDYTKLVRRLKEMYAHILHSKMMLSNIIVNLNFQKKYLYEKQLTWCSIRHG